RYCGLFIPYQKGPVSYQTAGGSGGVTYDYIISNDDVMYINNGEKKNSITNVERYINCINNENGKTVFFMRKDNTIWQYDTYTDEFTKTDITVSVTDKRGDINGDTVMDGKDLELLAQFITQPQSTVRAEDINGDGKINTFDIVALRRVIAEEK
ncbi:MAG TPA: dockerin type I repeat-containing protein, partial [Ruminococcus flavefaciens]|nr:dockerin type I repeat-containing protein [Ruminococcus flavefaciens]